MRFLTIGGLLAIILMAGCVSGGGGVECEDQECFAEQVAQCQAAQYTTTQVAGAVARYTVEGPTAEGCRIQLRYTENPNPDGLSEAQHGEAFYGTDRLTRLAADRNGDEDFLDTCLRDVDAFLQGAPRTDDLTLMVLQRNL